MSKIVSSQELAEKFTPIRSNVNIPKWWYKLIFRPDGKVISFFSF